ncbi:hypothetical protein ACFRAQ_34435 [Nocardia sp. NPDC056611]|uniref:hypothetical protein n=1 Tax=Nocardia sp. NPDC056611 TaxID=3345877 RepID=UPI00366BCC33
MLDGQVVRALIGYSKYSDEPVVVGPEDSDGHRRYVSPVQSGELIKPEVCEGFALALPEVEVCYDRITYWRPKGSTDYDMIVSDETLERDARWGLVAIAAYVARQRSSVAKDLRTVMELAEKAGAGLALERLRASIELGELAVALKDTR